MAFKTNSERIEEVLAKLDGREPRPDPWWNKDLNANRPDCPKCGVPMMRICFDDYWHSEPGWECWDDDSYIEDKPEKWHE